MSKSGATSMTLILASRTIPTAGRSGRRTDREQLSGLEGEQRSRRPESHRPPPAGNGHQRHFDARHGWLCSAEEMRRRTPADAVHLSVRARRTGRADEGFRGRRISDQARRLRLPPVQGAPILRMRERMRKTMKRTRRSCWNGTRSSCWSNGVNKVETEGANDDIVFE